MAERRWLTIIGLGADGVPGLPEAARRLLASARVIHGGARHLALVAGETGADLRPWQSPLERSLDEIVAARGEDVCVLASGDPFHHGIGATLARRVAPEEMLVLPAPSAFSLAAARLGWALQEVTTLSLHNRPSSLLRPHLHPGWRILALTSDAHGPAEIAALLTQWGFGPSRLIVLEALGSERERVRRSRADAFGLDAVDPLNLCALEVAAGPGATIVPLTPGLPDDLFEHDGQLTKSEIRALTLGALAPGRGETLWDIGAGAGSVGIEWMLQDPSLKAVAIEADPSRCARIARNAAALGVPGLRIVEGTAPQALKTLPAPDAVFIGGGGSDAGVLEAAITALRPGGRLVANAVTLELEALLLDRHATLGGSLIRLAVSRAGPLGAMTGWRPALPVTQWRWSKP